MGFIGSNFIHYHLKHYPDDFIVNLDVLTYAANPITLSDIEQQNYQFFKGNILDSLKVDDIINRYEVELIINFAAESHVDRSIEKPEDFIKTNVDGVLSLLKVAQQNQVKLIQISTDEVYGNLPVGQFAEEGASLNPSSPYAASKAAADLLVTAYQKTFDLKSIIIRSTNNYGPFQHVEKLIPMIITRGLKNEQIPIYGNGQNKRDWLYVEDNIRAIELVIHQGKDNEIYNVGTNRELSNLQVASTIIKELKVNSDLVEYVTDRPGHDLRYGVKTKKITALGWQQKYDFQSGIQKTLDWYRANRAWWDYESHNSIRDHL